jgi:hypothetical protein
VALVRTDVSKDLVAYIMKVERISELGTSAVSSNWVVLSSLMLVSLMMEAICSSETSVLTRTAWRHIPEDGIL